MYIYRYIYVYNDNNINDINHINHEHINHKQITIILKLSQTHTETEAIFFVCFHVFHVISCSAITFRFQGIDLGNDPRGRAKLAARGAGGDADEN
jgi:hypothetical protein